MRTVVLDSYGILSRTINGQASTSIREIDECLSIYLRLGVLIK